jgi:aquaporin Z
MRKYVVEFIGAFFLVLTIFCTVLKPNDGVIAPLAIGAALMVMVFAGGHLSGAHYNPAVTLAVTLRGKCSPADVPGYVVAQILGGLAAGFLATTQIRVGYTAAEPAALNVVPAFLAELLYTFALCYVVLNVATAKGTSGNSFYGLAIGMTVMVGAFAVGGVSGGAFNPAVAISAAVFKLIPMSQVWIHLVAELLAATAAGSLFLWLNPDDK